MTWVHCTIDIWAWGVRRLQGMALRFCKGTGSFALWSACEHRALRSRGSILTGQWGLLGANLSACVWWEIWKLHRVTFVTFNILGLSGVRWQKILTKAHPHQGLTEHIERPGGYRCRLDRTAFSMCTEQTKFRLPVGTETALFDPKWTGSLCSVIVATPFRISGTLGDASKHAFRAVALVMLRAKLADRHLASDHYCSDWWPRYKPLIFNNGVQIAFPPPTRTERLWTSLDLNMSEMKCWFWVDRSSRLGLLLWSCQDNQGTKSSYQPRSSRIQGGGRFASRPCLRTLIGGEHLRMRLFWKCRALC